MGETTIKVGSGFEQNELQRATISIKRFSSGSALFEVSGFPIDTKNLETMQTSLNQLKEFFGAVKALEQAVNQPQATVQEKKV